MFISDVSYKHDETLFSLVQHSTANHDDLKGNNEAELQWLEQVDALVEQNNCRAFVFDAIKLCRCFW